MKHTATDGAAWVSFNPDAGYEYSPQHPIQSGECVEASEIRKSTMQEDMLWEAMQQQFQRAEAAEAKARDLLAALQGAIGALEFSQDFHRDLGNSDQAFAADRLDAARAAIARATGASS